MASSCSSLSLLVLCILAISSNLLSGILATDSEIVEAITDGPPKAAGLNEATASKMQMMPVWNPDGSMQVQPYNILEANCPEGYVLANKHCHKRARNSVPETVNKLTENRV